MRSFFPHNLPLGYPTDKDFDFPVIASLESMYWKRENPVGLITTIGKTGRKQLFEANHKVRFYGQLEPPFLKIEADEIKGLFVLTFLENSVAGPSPREIEVLMAELKKEFEKNPLGGIICRTNVLVI